MLPIDLFAGAGLRLDDLVLLPPAAVLLLSTTASTADCPRCGTPADRVHSRYRRTVADLALRDRPVALRLVVRKFRCPQPGCPQKVFCERLPDLLEPYARATGRLLGTQRALGFALGGEAGARLAARLAVPTSPDTLLRRVKQYPPEPGPAPRIVGVDDWALRKGQRYATLLVDLERGRVIDLLPERDGNALEAWLKEHPGVQVVSRDRWAPYAQATTRGAPQAEQVADRWHLLKNLREVVERLLDRLSSELQPALQESPVVTDVPASLPVPDANAQARPEPAVAPPPPSPAPAAKRQRRLERFEQVRQLREAGTPLRQIARTLRMSVKTVRRYLRDGHCPDWKPGRQRPTRVDRYTDYIDRQIAEGCRNAAAVYRELVAQGCTASACAVLRFFNRRLAAAGRQRTRANAGAPRPPALPSARQLSFDFLRRAEDRDPSEQRRLEKVRGAAPEVEQALGLADEFVVMARQRSGAGLASWLTRAADAAAPEIRGFAAGIRQDEAAVTAGLTKVWSNGPVEGHVNRLKVIKRTMYGRASWELLRSRVLHAA